MRMRRLKHRAERLHAAASHLTEQPEALCGRWLATLFPEADRLKLELGCGKGRFLISSAQRSPHSLWIGVEKCADALVRALENAQAHSLANARFISADAAALPSLFAPGEVSDMFINFPDPWPHWKRAQLRLTHRAFLARYRAILAPGGSLRFKTDNAPLFRFSLGEFQAEGWTLSDVTENHPGDGDNVETEYESRFRAMDIPICALTARP